MSENKTAADAYIQALVDTKQYDPKDRTDLDDFIDKLEQKVDDIDEGVWLIRVYRNYGTERAHEFIRIATTPEGETSVARVDNELYKEELPVGPSVRSFIKYLLETWSIREKKIEAIIGEPKLRQDCTESANSDPGVPLTSKGLQLPKVK